MLPSLRYSPLLVSDDRNADRMEVPEEQSIEGKRSRRLQTGQKCFLPTNKIRLLADSLWCLQKLFGA